jgi:hypothetical protein
MTSTGADTIQRNKIKPVNSANIRISIACKARQRDLDKAVPFAKACKVDASVTFALTLDDARPFHPADAAIMSG